MRHVEIRDHQLGPPLGEVGERRLAFGGGAHLVPLTGQHRPQHARDLRLVVHYQHARLSWSSPSWHSWSLILLVAQAISPPAPPPAPDDRCRTPRHATGSVIEIDVPWSSTASTQIRPACASTSRRAIGSPRPMPPRRGSCDSPARHPEELLEHPLAQLGRNARPFVDHGDPDVAIAVPSGADGNRRCPPARTCSRCRAGCRSPR